MAPLTKLPFRRWLTLARAGALRIPMTTGLLVGIGETREERLRDLQNIRRLHERYGHIQEVIIQNFCAKPGTRMAEVDSAAFEELLVDGDAGAVAVARRKSVFRRRRI